MMITSGQWSFKKFSDGEFDITSDKPSQQCTYTAIATVREEADARLIAAAPDLLDAAKFALISLSAAANCLGDENMYAAARADLHKAIAKAEGERK